MGASAQHDDRDPAWSATQRGGRIGRCPDVGTQRVRQSGWRIMPQLLALAYADEYRAAEVIAFLQRLQIGSAFGLKYVVGVARRMDWSVAVQCASELADEGECPCHFWRPLIASLILTPGVSSQRARCEDFGLDPDFERRLGGVLPPGSSAVFMIVPWRSLARTRAEIDCLQGTLLTSPIRIPQPVGARNRRQLEHIGTRQLDLARSVGGRRRSTNASVLAMVGRGHPPAVSPD